MLNLEKILRIQDTVSASVCEKLIKLAGEFGK